MGVGGWRNMGWSSTKDCSGLPWGFSGQPAPVPVETRARRHGHGFCQVRVVGFKKPRGHTA